MRTTIAALLVSGLPACASQDMIAEIAPGRYLLVLNKADATLHVIEPTSGLLHDHAPTGVGPHEIAVSRDGSRAVVTNYGDETAGSTLLVYDLEHEEREFTLDLAPHTRPHGVAFLSFRDRVLVTSETSQAVLEVDLASRSVTRVMKTGQEATHMLVLAPDKKRVYTANIKSGTVSAIDLESGALVGTVATGKQPEAIDITPDGRELWVGHNGDHKLVVIDTASLAILAEVPCGPLPIRVKCTPDGRSVLASCALSGEVALIDRATRREVQRFRLARRAAPAPGAPPAAGVPPESSDDNPMPVGLLIEPSGRYAFVACTRAARVDVLDLEARGVRGSYPVGQAPDGLGWTYMRQPFGFAGDSRD